MDASDTLRLLGKYPDEELAAPPAQSAGVHHFRRRKPRKASTILAMAPLPLGTTSHPTEQYSLVAMLTPIKLVIVGLKPSPKTWYRRHREVESTGGARSKFKGTLAWFPSITPQESLNQARPANETAKPGSTIPMLVHSWGDSLFLIRVSETKFMQPTRNARTGKVTNIETGRVVFEEVGQWTASGDILALQWLNVNQVVVLTTKALEVYDIRSTRLVEHASCDAWQLVSPVLSHTTNGTVSYPDAVTEVAHSFRVYKGKIFMLCQQELQVGTLLTWADRILSYVGDGDFLSAIELTRMYYVGESPGNRNGLPESPSKLKQVVGDKMHELMIASASYAFSEDRMTDGTHVTPDGRGVDRTSLFEGLVKTCVRASIALDDYDFLFEDLFQYYDDNGIGHIFLLQMEAFVLDGQLHNVPPRITQRLIALHEEDGRPDLAERIIWHIDAECLDVNQAITLCQRHRLYDALLYVYTRALKDYVSPVVELIGLVRKVQQFRRARAEDLSSAPRAKEEEIEPVILNAYKIYPYLGNTLTGLSYPSAKPIPDDEGLQAKNDVYTFLFNGRSSVWPQGEGGNLVLTADEENGVEPTFPYTRLLLRFDPEAFLHTLDLAFEDSHLNDETRGVSRLIIVKILLEILSSPGLDREVVTFINIFIARNVPKYPQFIQIPPSALQNILVGLAEDSDEGTREDRQLAAEYLLSAYTPHDTARIIALFEEARFYRILRSWYRQERRWPALLLTFFKDPSLPRSDIFLCVSDVLESSKRLSKGELPKEVLTTVTDHLSTLLAYSVPDTAALLDESIPALHERVVELLSTKTNDADRFLYFRYLLGPPLGEDDGTVPSRVGGPSPHVPPSLRRMYVADLCRFEPTKVISSLRYLSAEFVDAAEVARICEENGAYDAVIWTLNRQGDAVAALSKAEIFERELCNDLAEELVRADSQSEEAIGNYLSVLMNIAGAAVSVCLEQSQIMRSDDKLPLEDFWYTLLRFQIDAVQRVASCCSPEALTAVLVDSADSRRVAAQMQALSTLRSQVQESFTSLLSVSSTKAVSMPRLFKRLLTSSPSDGVSHPTLYAEFRTLFTGMLESYRSDGDMLTITKHLVDRDLFYAIENLVQERHRGWAPSQGVCRGCNGSFLDINKTAEADARSGVPIIVSRTGAIYHNSCLPPDYPRANASSVH
ncbi:hypothetical protein WOLCODRAFT_140212 [Wolfiporia cocos MD-104 SS10]|uniref:Uncharacterized protein n=1 Tax=Wolfiporia cocos (strain MD-104) TaxID=742152 RepID=A0A2H3JH96_WOLCO|nr:hypothetical protein WOLCODRAFT_140212 [Wolfiporia cocos MD-104 SS10]